MKIGKLTDIPGYVPVRETARWKQANSEYLNYKAFIPANLVVMAPIALISYWLARRAFSSHNGLVRWVGGGGAIAGGVLGILVVLFFWVLVFYNKPSDAGPGSPWVKWVDDYQQDQAFLVAGKLLGHQPADAFQLQIDQSVHLVANREILVLTYAGTYVMAEAAEVESVRELMREDIQHAVRPSPYTFENLDPKAAVVSLILSEPPQHEWGGSAVGPFEIVLRTARPHAIWINRESAPLEHAVPELTNDDFMARLMQALRPTS